MCLYTLEAKGIGTLKMGLPEIVESLVQGGCWELNSG
jgi:hypothetical protein